MTSGSPLSLVMVELQLIDLDVLPGRGDAQAGDRDGLAPAAAGHRHGNRNQRQGQVPAACRAPLSVTRPMCLFEIRSVFSAGTVSGAWDYLRGARDLSPRGTLAQMRRQQNFARQGRTGSRSRFGWLLLGAAAGGRARAAAAASAGARPRCGAARATAPPGPAAAHSRAGASRTPPRRRWRSRSARNGVWPRSWGSPATRVSAPGRLGGEVSSTVCSASGTTFGARARAAAERAGGRPAPVERSASIPRNTRALAAPAAIQGARPARPQRRHQRQAPDPRPGARTGSRTSAAEAKRCSGSC
jgi:hypothetical protein